MLPPSLANMMAKREVEITFRVVESCKLPEHVASITVVNAYKVFREPSLHYYDNTTALPLECGFMMLCEP